jgi:hypothetical protein
VFVFRGARLRLNKNKNTEHSPDHGYNTGASEYQIYSIKVDAAWRSKQLLLFETHPLAPQSQEKRPSGNVTLNYIRSRREERNKNWQTKPPSHSI